MTKIRGFKVFRPDWTCSPNGNTKQYACPGKFEEEGELDVCGHGMHFCQTAADCFNYYSFNSENKVAELEQINHCSENEWDSELDEKFNAVVEAGKGKR